MIARRLQIEKVRFCLLKTVSEEDNIGWIRWLRCTDISWLEVVVMNESGM